MTPPSLAGVSAALRFSDARWSWVRPAPEEIDIAEVLDETERQHAPGADDPDPSGKYGRCEMCREPWPCPPWLSAQAIGVEYLGHAADRYIARARSRSVPPSPKEAA